MATTFAVKRIYASPEEADGYRVLVDRLWPRGMSRERAAIDAWNKDVTPSPALRDRWHANREAFDEFAARYRIELAESGAIDALLAATRDRPRVTLVYAYRDPQRNHALVLLEEIRRVQRRAEEAGDLGAG
ncbi:DUF488 domain-containing protein [Demequina litorisediminis]|uniref:DUF488 family protein n=1 Tax=Demequina litorisediminis TaxID=1849022 RepID=A0ABQ6I9G5_9MICO|nr:DUF488 family protein [Demequina litorisediminis]GMA34264.1 hypothetical protein GCM10025876_04680 [Demequina litorisediminis]